MWDNIQVTQEPHFLRPAGDGVQRQTPHPGAETTKICLHFHDLRASCLKWSTEFYYSYFCTYYFDF